MSKRLSKLIYTEVRTNPEDSHGGFGEVLYRSENGIPILWLFCFGARNIWTVGDDIESRGGAAGQRNPLETEIDVAITRLEAAEDALPMAMHIGPWLSGAGILRRRLLARPKTGYLRIAAPWIFKLDDQALTRFRTSLAYAENIVNLCGARREIDAATCLNSLEEFSPFVPSGDGKDRPRAEKVAGAGMTLGVTVALATLGDPGDRAVMEKSANKDIGPAIAKNSMLPPLKLAKNSQPGKPGGLLKKLGGMFRK